MTDCQCRFWTDPRNVSGVTSDVYIAARLRNSSSHQMRFQLCSVWSATIRWHRISFRMVPSTELSGANYYVSMRQVLESDRKIRALSLTKFSGYPLAEIDEAIETAELSSAANEYLDSSTADAISDKLTYQTWPSASDVNIIAVTNA